MFILEHLKIASGYIADVDFCQKLVTEWKSYYSLNFQKIIQGNNTIVTIHLINM